MAWFKRENKESENLEQENAPFSANFPADAEQNQFKKLPTITLPPLPSFPRTQFGNTAEIGMVKSIVSPEINQPAQIMQPEPQMPSRQLVSPPPISRNFSKEAEPIFVKLENFRSAVDNFERVKGKINEIEELLKRINDVKHQEEKEMQEWENELQSVKEKIDSIDNSLFKKMGE